MFFEYWRRGERRMAVLSIFELNVVVHASESWRDGAMSQTLIASKECETLIEGIPQYFFGIYTLANLELEGHQEPSTLQRLSPVINVLSIAHTLSARTIRLHPRSSSWKLHAYLTADFIFHPITICLMPLCTKTGHDPGVILLTWFCLVPALWGIVRSGMSSQSFTWCCKVFLAHLVVSPVVALSDGIPFCVRSGLMFARRWMPLFQFVVFVVVTGFKQSRDTTESGLGETLIQCAAVLLFAAPVLLHVLGRSWNAGWLRAVAYFAGVACLALLPALLQSLGVSRAPPSFASTVYGDWRVASGALLVSSPFIAYAVQTDLGMQLLDIQDGVDIGCLESLEMQVGQ
eukprot:TRINITY_DN28127_c0_g1_i5.p1 TRINITY_DN28127_c0_g1~~TRINITY_DN28127_c0_g1_i5.p1  ORF type:complete len:345 (+),score=2.15 TRINITY_DN28127_c0_g1_i5:652-1686(+)